LVVVNFALKVAGACSLSEEGFNNEGLAAGRCDAGFPAIAWVPVKPQRIPGVSMIAKNVGCRFFIIISMSLFL
jgi:hypothetical protein